MAWPTEIWPSLVQMGCRRAGWYSHDGLDNGGVPSADRIVPELQRVEVGDVFPWTPNATDGFIVRPVEPERALILGGDAVPVIWALVLQPIDEATTRLLARGRGSYERFAIGLMLRIVWRPIHFGMQRRRLLNLKLRVRRRDATPNRRPHRRSPPSARARPRPQAAPADGSLATTGSASSAMAALNLAGSSTNGSCPERSNQTSSFRGALSAWK